MRLWTLSLPPPSPSDILHLEYTPLGDGDLAMQEGEAHEAVPAAPPQPTDQSDLERSLVIRVLGPGSSSAW